MRIVNGLQRITNAISAFASMHTGEEELNEAFKLFASEILNILEADFILLKFIIDKKTKIISVGISDILAENIINKIFPDLKRENLNIESYVLPINTSDPFLSHNRIKIIYNIPLIGRYDNIGRIAVFYSNHTYEDNKKFKVEDDTFKLIQNLGKTLLDLYEFRMQYEYLSNQIKQIDSYFDNSIQINFILDSGFNIIKINDFGKTLFKKSKLSGGDNFLDIIADEREKNQFESDIKTLKMNQDSGEIYFHIKNDYINNDTDTQMSFSAIIKKIPISDNTQGNYYIFVNIRILYEIDDDFYNPLHSDASIISKLNYFYKILKRDPQKSYEFAKTNFFPAIVSFVMNEVMGPIPLAAYPEDIELNKIFEGGMKLFSGLSSEMILTQSYITGISPWEYPKGELHWIAFTIQNEKARGGVELHLLGIVTMSKLLTARPILIQAMLGNLLGLMNQYIALITEESADFCTTEYNKDRNFATIALIKKLFEQIQTISVELLATYTQNQNILR